MYEKIVDTYVKDKVDTSSIEHQWLVLHSILICKSKSTSDLIVHCSYCRWLFTFSTVRFDMPPTTSTVRLCIVQIANDPVDSVISDSSDISYFLKNGIFKKRITTAQIIPLFTNTCPGNVKLGRGIMPVTGILVTNGTLPWTVKASSIRFRYSAFLCHNNQF